MNRGYGDAGASWHKKATKGFRAMSGSPKEDIDANNYTLRQRSSGCLHGSPDRHLCHPHQAAPTSSASASSSRAGSTARRSA
ncbi:MAG: hypothetical protein ACLU38_04370 [Dysosmobacter sp.]